MTARRAAPRRVAHFKRYELNDSLDGVALARARGYRWIDLNFHVTADGYLVCTHWGRPLEHGWYDPRGILNRHDAVWEMDVHEVKRLRHSRTRRARIVTARTILRRCKRLRIAVEFEAKNSPAFASSDAPWATLRRLVDDTGVRLIVKTIVPLDKGRARIARAKAAGFHVIALRARPPLTGLADEYRP